MQNVLVVDVSLETECLGEPLTTEGTSVVVFLPVPDERGEVPKCCRTVLTGVRLLSCVDPQVNSESIFRLQSFTTNLTLVNVSIFMDLLDVIPQISESRKEFPTSCTLMTPESLMEESDVILQHMSPCEFLLAVVAFHFHL